MKKLIDFFIKEKLMITLFVVVILIAGFFTLTDLNRESFPDVNLDMVTIRTIYPGAAPDGVENLVTIPLEKELRGVVGLDKVICHNIENASVIIAYIDERVKDKKKVVENIKDAVQRVTGLPASAEEPLVLEITTEETPAIDIALMIDGEDVESYAKLRATAKQLEDELLFVEGVARIDKLGYLDREYLIEVNPSALSRYRVGLNTVIYRLKMRNIDLPGGVLRIGDNEFILRTMGQYKDAEEIRNTVIFSNDAGFVTRLKDIAKVTDTFKESEILERLNRKNAIILKVNKKHTADMINVTDEIKLLLKNFEKTLPQDVSLHYFNDYSRFVRSRLSSLITNAVIGFVLLLVILVLMLGFRMSAIVSISIPVTFMIAFMAMHFAGITLNVISMFALVMVLGMIVDFSIVVTENSYRYLERGMSKREAVEIGVAEVFPSMTTTLLCIIAAFAPLLFVSGLVGKFIYAIPMVIIICLAASWLSAVLILPSFFDSFAKVNIKEKKIDDKKPVRKKSDFYRKFLTKTVKHRYLAVFLLFLLLIFTVKIGTKYIDFVLMTSASKGVFIKTKMPQGTNLLANEKALIQLEKLIDIYPRNIVENIHTRIGTELGSRLDTGPKDGTHRGTIHLLLSPANDRNITGEEIQAELRKKIEEARKKGEIDRRLDIKYELDLEGLPVGNAINVEIRGDDFVVLNKIATEYSQFLKTIKGVNDISIDLEEGKAEYRYQINEALATQVGLSVSEVAQALYASFKGAVATTQKKGDEEIDLRVRFPDWARRQQGSLQDVMVANTYGGLIPLSKVTRHQQQKGFAMINRKNYKRIVQVKANVDSTVITSMVANNLLQKKFTDIEKRYPGYTIKYGGEKEDMEKSIASLGTLFFIAICVIYIVLAAFFNSLLLPVVVMICIPFSLIGIYFALFLHGMQPLSFMSLLGFFSLAGVIVSNTLILVQFINNLRYQGFSLKESVIEGGALRFRPVLLTSGTTVLGLLPTIYGLGGKDEFVAPLGLAFGYGLIFATVITLVMVPCFYHIAEDFKLLWAKLLKKFGIEIDGRLKDF